MDSQKEPGIQIAQVFLNKALFEHVGNPLEVAPTEQPGEHEISIAATLGQSADGRSGIASVVVQTSPESKGRYRFVVEMVLLVAQEEGNENLSIPEYLSGAGAPTVFPFIRELVANLTARGRFGPLWIKPVNFAAAETIPLGPNGKEIREEKGPTS